MANGRKTANHREERGVGAEEQIDVTISHLWNEMNQLGQWKMRQRLLIEERTAPDFHFQRSEDDLIG